MRERLGDAVERLAGSGEPAGEAVDLDAEWRRQNRYDRRAALLRNEQLTPTGTFRLTFETVDGTPLRFEPGQFIGITDRSPEGRRRRSPYCLASPPTAAGRFDLVVREVAEGPMSQKLAALEPGEEIEFRGPVGRSMVPKRTDTDVVLLATGVGVGPLLPLARHLLETTPQRTVTLYWGLRLREDICLLPELDELVSQHPSAFSSQITLSQPDDEWDGLRGRLTESVPPRLPTVKDTNYVMVGNGAMIAEVTAALSDLGVPETQMHGEHYFNGRYEPALETIREIRRRFAARDAEPDDTTLW